MLNVVMLSVIILPLMLSVIGPLKLVFILFLRDRTQLKLKHSKALFTQLILTDLYGNASKQCVLNIINRKLKNRTIKNGRVNGR